MMSATSVGRTQVEGHSRPTTAQLGKLVTYATALAGIYLTFGFLFYYSAKSKLIDGSGTMPAGLQKAFAGSFIASFPGNNAAWVILGILEAIVVVLLAVSLVTGEFLTNRHKPFLLAGLGVAMLTFAALCFGDNMIGDHASVFNLFTYFALTPAVIFLVRMMPPYRSLGWISGTEDDKS